MVADGVVTDLISGEVVATGVSYEDYMERYAADFCEWVGGVVIKMSPLSEKHDNLTYHLRNLFASYFELRSGGGKVRSASFVMKIPDHNVVREPDLQVILDSNQGSLTPTAMIGPADICIEVVSPESVERDHVEKFFEYEKGGVREYWIIDPLRHEALFYRLDDAGNYLRYPEDAQGEYRTPLLPGLVLDVPLLWQPTLPGPGATFQAVQEMLNEA